MAPLSVISVRRQEVVLIVPSKPTPYEHKLLSDIDDQSSNRYKVSMFLFYRNDPSKIEKKGCRAGVAKVINDAIVKALVFYYPLAGRLREGPDGKLVVECNAEGVQFCEADADACLDQFGEVLGPPFPCEKELCYDPVGPRKMIGCPLLLIQVTRLRCGGFILAVRFNHTMMDGLGMFQFLQAVTEMARGSDEPSIRPVWARQVLMARTPPHVTHQHLEYVSASPIPPTVKSRADQLLLRSLFFGFDDITALRAHLPPHLRTVATTFEVLAACVWRSMSIALYSADRPDEQVRILVVCNVLSSESNVSPGLPRGYYGNAFAYALSRSSVGELGTSPLGYAVTLVRAAEASVTEGYLQSMADLMVLRGRPGIVEERTLVVANLTNVGLDRLDFGWGKPAYGGASRGALMTGTGVTTAFTSVKNAKGEDGVLVPMALLRTAMDRFEEEIGRLKSNKLTTSREEMKVKINVSDPANSKL